MRRTESLEDLVQRGQEMSSQDEPLAAWNGQQSTHNERFHVIFNGKVYYNTAWVDSGQRPGDINETTANPWKYEREATKKEMTQLGNPTGDGHLHHSHPLKH
jgi:hypothetical protein